MTPAVLIKRAKFLLKLVGSIGVPIVVVKTKPVSFHLEPANITSGGCYLEEFRDGSGQFVFEIHEPIDTSKPAWVADMEWESKADAGRCSADPARIAEIVPIDAVTLTALRRGLHH